MPCNIGLVGVTPIVAKQSIPPVMRHCREVEQCPIPIPFAGRASLAFRFVVELFNRIGWQIVSNHVWQSRLFALFINLQWAANDLLNAQSLKHNAMSCAAFITYLKKEVSDKPIYIYI